MGWSCRIEVSDTLRAWHDACVASTGSSNVFKVGGTSYFFDVSNREHDDGAATGKVLRMLEVRPDGSGPCVPAGTFRIEPDGSVSRGPKFLKDAAKNAVSTRGYGIGSGGF